MSLQTALTGLNGAQTGLDTVSNDLANADTTAFKSQTAEFSDIYAYGETNAPGLGVTSSSMDTDYSQGALVSTGNPLDAAIQGNGFFVVSQNGTQEYTRDGSFELNPAGQLVSASSGATVMGITGTGALGPITVNTGAMPAMATTTSALSFTLNSNAPTTPSTTTIPGVTPAVTYTESYPVTVYDSLGNADTVNLYFAQNTGTTPTSYTVYAQPQTSTGAAATTATTMLGTMAFNTNGTIASFTAAGTATQTGTDGATLPIAWGNGSGASAIDFNFAGTTEGAQSFAVASNNTNGYAPGNYDGTTINAAGDLVATYSNGQTVNAGTLAVANFINEQGLNALSGNLYASTTTSGQPVINAPGTGQAGAISGGELEQSNASTSELLVSLIEYQQAYQADTSVIQTEQTDSTRLTQI